jgi:hypothetical protein
MGNNADLMGLFFIIDSIVRLNVPESPECRSGSDLDLKAGPLIWASIAFPVAVAGQMKGLIRLST